MDAGPSMAPNPAYNLESVKNLSMRIGETGLALAACCFVFSSCSSSRHEPGETYYLVAANINVPYWQTAGSGLVKAAREMGVAAQVVGPTNYDPNAQHEAFQHALSKKPAGILVTATDANVLTPDIDAAIGQHVPVLTIDSDAPNSKRLFFVGTNNHEVGVLGGRLLIKLTGGKANVVFYTNPGQPNLQERLSGYKEALADSPGIKIARIVDIKGTPEIAFDTTAEILKSKNSPDAFVCLLSIACKEVADVMNRQNVSGKTVIAMDTDKDTLDWLQKGVISATIAQKPYTMAYFGLNLLDMIHHSKSLGQGGATNTLATLPVFVDTGTTLIDKSNVAEFIQSQGAASSAQ